MEYQEDCPTKDQNGYMSEFEVIASLQWSDPCEHGNFGAIARIEREALGLLAEEGGGLMCFTASPPLECRPCLELLIGFLGSDNRESQRQAATVVYKLAREAGREFMVLILDSETRGRLFANRFVMTDLTGMDTKVPPYDKLTQFSLVYAETHEEMTKIVEGFSCGDE